MELFRWPAADAFKNRVADLRVLEEWWSDPHSEPINLYGRRRVGKSWLFRKFADGKPAVVLVAQESATAAAGLAGFARQLEPHLGVKPSLTTVAELFDVLYQLSTTHKVLAVIDEFPYLLGSSHIERRQTLTATQAVMEERRDRSQLKLIVAGSLVSEMERLQEPKSPLYGRLRPLELRPLPFEDARSLISADPLESLTRYSVAGGMPRYLTEFGSGDLSASVISAALDPRGGLFNEPANLLNNEVRAPRTYLSILSELSRGARQIGDIAAALSMSAAELTPYLATLESMRMAQRALPVGANPGERRTAWRCSDHFVRFWFRFVRPYQAELEAGADPAAHWTAVVEPHLSSHAAPVFEEVLRSWLRREYATRVLGVGSWWGNSLNRLRRSGERSAEEIDAVGIKARKVVVVAEAKWTNAAMGADVLRDLRDYKVPALGQAGFDVTSYDTVLASRSGFSQSLIDLAAVDDSVHLVDASTVLSSS